MFARRIHIETKQPAKRPNYLCIKTSEEIWLNQRWFKLVFVVRNIKALHKMRSKGIRFILTFRCIHHNIFRDIVNKYAYLKMWCIRRNVGTNLIISLLRILCWALIFLTRLRFPPGQSLANCFHVACIRSVLEYACEVFHCRLPEYLVDKIQRIQIGSMRKIFPKLS